MAHDLHFDVAASHPFDAVIDTVVLELATAGEPGAPVVELVGEGMTLTCGALMKLHGGPLEPGSDPVGDLGVEPTATIWWRVDSALDQDVQVDRIVALVGGLLRRIEGPVALTHLYDHVRLLRGADGRLVVSDDPWFWTSERLDALPRPFERAPLAFPD